MFSTWSKNKENRLKNIYPHKTDQEIADTLKVSISFVNQKAEELGLVKENIKRVWSGEEVDYVKLNYGQQDNESLAHALGASKLEISHLIYRLGLRRTHGRLKDDNDLVKQWSKEWNKEMKCSKGHYVTKKILEYSFPYHAIREEEPIGNLWVDLYIPQLGIAFEVHGIQHMEFNLFFHNTKDDFKRGQDNDWRKSEMLEDKNIALVVVYHDEDLSINLINRKIREVL